MLKLCCALGAVGAAAYTAPLARHRRLALRTPSGPAARAPARRATTEWSGSDVDPWNPISEDRVFEVCYLDEAGEHIEECVCESEAELIEKGLVPPRRGKDNSDLLFAVPNSGADGETLFSLADYETCLADDICVVPDEIVDKAYGRSRRFEVLRCLHFLGWTRVHLTMPWVVSFSSLRPFRAGTGTTIILRMEMMNGGILKIGTMMKKKRRRRSVT